MAEPNTDKSESVTDLPRWEDLDAYDAEHGSPFDEPLEKSGGGVLETAGKVAKDIGGGILELPGQVNRGAVSALNETSNAVYGLITQPAVKWVHENVYDMSGITPGIVSGAKNPLQVSTDTAFTPKAETNTGEIIKSVSQFAAGYVMAGRFLKLAGMAAPATAGAQVAQGAGKGMIADMFSFDPHEERLSNFIEKHTNLRDPVTQFLAARPDDTEAVGRLKNAVEGLGLGMAVEGLVLGLRFTKAMRAGDKAEAAKIADEMEAAGLKGEDVDLSKDKLPEPEAPAPKPEEPGVKPANDDAAAPNANPEAPPKEAPKASAGEDAKISEPAGPKPSNDDIPAPERPIKVDEKALRESIDLHITENAYGQGRNLSGIRTDLIENGEDLAAIMSATQRQYKEAMTAARGGTDYLSHAEIRAQADEIADIVGTDSTSLIERMGRTAQTLEDLPASILMYRDVLKTAESKLVEVAKIYHDPLGGVGPYKNRAEVTAAFIQNYEVFANIQRYYRGQQTNIARALGSMRITAKENAGALKDLDAGALREMGEERMRSMAGDILGAAHGPGGKVNSKGIAKVVRGGFGKNLLDLAISYRVNAMLSGATTQVVNIGGSLMTAGIRPIEKFMSGSLRMGTQAGRDDMIEAGLQYGTMLWSVRDAISLAAKAWKLNGPVLDPSRQMIEGKHHLRPVSDMFNIKDPVGATVADALGTAMNLPGRMMMTTDEFIKQISYRGEVRAQALREGLEEGSWWNGDFSKFGEIAAKRLDESVDDTGRALNASALEHAREVTFQKDLKASSWFANKSLSESIQGMAGNHPGVRVILPFIRTPANIFRYGWDRTPVLNMARKEFYDQITGKRGAELRNDAIGKMATGGLMWASAIGFSVDGTITGGGPADPKQRKMLEDTGWRPYSVRIKNDDGSTSYISYQRLDPFATFLGLAADMTEHVGNWNDMEFGEFAGQGLIAIVKQLNSKSFMQGLTDTLDALADPDKNFEKFARNMVGSFVPAALTRANNDPHAREVRSVLDELRKRTPGFSQDLDPQRNILGEAITPPPTIGPSWLSPVIKTNHWGDQTANTAEWRATPQADPKDEMARLAVVGNKSFTPPAKEQEGIDLTEHTSPVTGKTAYDRLQELTGTVRMNGKSLTEMLERAVSSDAYKNRMTDSDEELDGSRIGYLKTIIGSYRLLALQALKKEMPGLADEMKQQTIAKARALVQTRPQN